MTDTWRRRSLISGLSALGAFWTVGARTAAAAPPTTFEPARHAQDEWLDKLPGKHRVFIDCSTPRAAADGLLYANNIFLGNQSGYGLSDAEVAIVVCLRHQAALFAFTDVVWAKHGKALADSAGYVDPKGLELVANPYASTARNTIGTLAKRGVHYAICDLSARRLSRLLAGTGGDAEAMYKHMAANVVPNGRLVPAGVVALTRAQEYGYSFLYAG